MTNRIVSVGDSFALPASVLVTDANLPAASKAAAIALKADTSALTTHTSSVSNPHAVTKAQVGLGSADNTADTAKPISTAQAAGLALKAPIASPTFTGTVSGVTKAHVGLGSVDNTADADKPVSTAAVTALAAKRSLTDLVVNAKDFGLVGDGVTDDSVGMAALLAATPAAVDWGRGTYYVPYATSLSGIETITHLGNGSIKKSSTTFRLYGRKSLSQTNIIYVATTGSDTNDGMHQNTPIKTLAKAAALIHSWADGGLNGLWTVQLAAGTYNTVDDGFRLNSLVKSDYPILIKGPGVSGHPNVPTAIIDNTGGTAVDIFSNSTNTWLQVEDVKVQNHPGNAFSVNKASLSLTNVHVLNVDTGVSYIHGAMLSMAGGIFDGGTITATNTGIKGFYGSTHSIVGTSLATGTVFKNWFRGVQVGEGTFGHLDYTTAQDCTVGIYFNRAGSGANTKSMQIYRCGTGVQAFNSSWYNNGIDFGLGTGNACTVAIDERGDSAEFAFRVQDNVSKTLRQMGTYRGATRTGTTTEGLEFSSVTITKGKVTNAAIATGHTTRATGCVSAAVTSGSNVKLRFQWGPTTTDSVEANFAVAAASLRAYYDLEITTFTPTSHRMILKVIDPQGLMQTAYKDAAVDMTSTDVTLKMYYKLNNTADTFAVVAHSLTTTIGG